MLHHKTIIGISYGVLSTLTHGRCCQSLPTHQLGRPKPIKEIAELTVSTQSNSRKYETVVKQTERKSWLCMIHMVPLLQIHSLKKLQMPNDRKKQNRIYAMFLKIIRSQKLSFIHFSNSQGDNYYDINYEKRLTVQSFRIKRNNTRM